MKEKTIPRHKRPPDQKTRSYKTDSAFVSPEMQDKDAARKAFLKEFWSPRGASRANCWSIAGRLGGASVFPHLEDDMGTDSLEDSRSTPFWWKIVLTHGLEMANTGMCCKISASKTLVNESSKDPLIVFQTLLTSHLHESTHSVTPNCCPSLTTQGHELPQWQSSALLKNVPSPVLFDRLHRPSCDQLGCSSAATRRHPAPRCPLPGARPCRPGHRGCWGPLGRRTKATRGHWDDPR